MRRPVARRGLLLGDLHHGRARLSELLGAFGELRRGCLSARLCVTPTALGHGPLCVRLARHRELRLLRAERTTLGRERDAQALQLATIGGVPFAGVAHATLEVRVALGDGILQTHHLFGLRGPPHLTRFFDLLAQRLGLRPGLGQRRLKRRDAGLALATGHLALGRDLRTQQGDPRLFGPTLGDGVGQALALFAQLVAQQRRLGLNAPQLSVAASELLFRLFCAL